MKPVKIIIHGVHRSGTSITTSIIEKMGAWYAEDWQKMLPADDNQNGFWERLDVVKINDLILRDFSMSWNSLKPCLNERQIKASIKKYSSQIQTVLDELNSHDSWFIKEPRMSFTWPIWQHFIDDDAYHIIVHRHPLAVARSLEKRNNIPIESGLTFWTHQELSILSSLKNEKHVINITFDGTQSGTSKMLDNIKVLLDEKIKNGPLTPLTKKQEDAFFDNKLVHQRNDETIIEGFSQTHELWKCIINQKPFDALNLEAQINTNELGWHILDSTQNTTSIINDLQETIDNQNSYIKSQEATIQSKENQIKELYLHTQEVHKELLKSLYEFKESKSHNVAQLLLKPLGFIRKPQKGALDHIHEKLISELNLPKDFKTTNTKVELIATLLRNPLALLKKLSISRIKTVIKILLDKNSSQIDIEQALSRYRTTLGKEEIALEIYDNKALSIEDIQLVNSKSPKISIIIPVYNNHKTTISCLKSIQENTEPELAYEVIIADDCSNDETQKFTKNHSLKIVRTEKNLGFLGNCNNAAKEAKGEFIVLLNNDTNVQKNWLSLLYKEIVDSEEIGVVGPRFLYPDGRLQEAGGIIFSDASGWNYGRLDNPNKPEYLFSRNVDYISGACLMFRSSDWRALKGFDTRFSPAYYEDTDFCFAIRQRDLTIRYVPSSRVVHFEGISHGTDESSGMKKYQSINREKFAEKWRTELIKEHYHDSSLLFKARHHGKTKKTVLVIDHYVPMFDKDAGSRSTYMYLNLFLEEGIKVIFMGDNFYPHQPYTQHLQDKGIEVLYGDFYQKNWLTWLSKNNAFIDAIYIHRPHIASQYIDKIRAIKSHPRIVYFGHDLHFLRLQREENLGMENNSGKSIEAWQSLELEVMRKSDITLYPADYEVEAIQQLDSSININSIPLNWFNKTFTQTNINIHSKPNLLFIGSFGHPPNKDGLHWFLHDIFPTIVKQVPEVKLIIIGSRCPDEIFELANNNIEVLGEVSDLQLQQAYSSARIAVVPLRYGAGVKGKVIEAMASGTTVLTTPIGAEGLPEKAENYLSIANNEQEFANSAITLLKNTAICQEKCSVAYTILDKHFSKTAALKLINHLFPSQKY